MQIFLLNINFKTKSFILNIKHLFNCIIIFYNYMILKINQISFSKYNFYSNL